MRLQEPQTEFTEHGTKFEKYRDWRGLALRHRLKLFIGVLSLSGLIVILCVIFVGGQSTVHAGTKGICDGPGLGDEFCGGTCVPSGTCAQIQGALDAYFNLFSGIPCATWAQFFTGTGHQYPSWGQSVNGTAALIDYCDGRKDNFVSTFFVQNGKFSVNPQSSSNVIDNNNQWHVLVPYLFTGQMSASKGGLVFEEGFASFNLMDGLIQEAVQFQNIYGVPLNSSMYGEQTDDWVLAGYNTNTAAFSSPHEWKDTDANANAYISTASELVYRYMGFTKLPCAEWNGIWKEGAQWIVPNWPAGVVGASPGGAFNYKTITTLCSVLKGGNVKEDSVWSPSGFLRVSVSGDYIFALAPFTYANFKGPEYDIGYQYLKIDKASAKVVLAEEYATGAAAFNNVPANFYNRGISSDSVFGS